ncbi:MAG: YggU family protein [Burkholderiales bacterium]|nr:YggU family protein [Burkholderiales bacterium]
MSESSWFRRDGDDWVLSLYLQPGAKKTAPAGLHDGALKLRLAAPPVEGKANAALISWLADWFEVPKNRVCIEQGELSRHKRVRVSDSHRHPQALESA